MSDRVALLGGICIAVFIALVLLREGILRRRRKEEEKRNSEKELVAQFLLSIYPESATMIGIKDHMQFDLFRVRLALRALEQEGRVSANFGSTFTYIVQGMSRRPYPPLRLVK